MTADRSATRQAPALQGLAPRSLPTGAPRVPRRRPAALDRNLSLHALLPRLTLSRKIFLALASLLVLLLVIFTGFSIFGLQRDLGPYVAEIQVRRMGWLAERLQQKYAADGGWHKLQADRAAWRRLQMGGPGHFLDNGARDATRRLLPWYGDGPPDAFPGDPLPPPLHFSGDEGPPPWPDSVFERLGLLDSSGGHVAGATATSPSAARLPIQHAGHVVGYLVLAPIESLRSRDDRAFLARQSGFIALTGLSGLIVALALSWWLSRRWFAPIDDLTQGAKSVASGRLDVRVSVQGSDELALLGHTFNSMTRRLDAIETSRREWLADVAHELRTPLAVMRAEIEALQDGVHTFDDKIALQLHRQVMRLAQLVDDLRNSMRDPQGSPLPLVPVDPLALLTEAAAMARPRFLQKGISLDSTRLKRLACQPMVHGDARRLDQVFTNLLENSLAYTHSGGTLQLDASVEGQPGEERLLLCFDDTAPGPSAGDLPRLFDRLFRGESSRSRETGGSGLGLSICRAIVEEHGGTIEAASSPLGGLRISLLLPLAQVE